MADDNNINRTSPIPLLTGWDRDHDIRELKRLISLGVDNADACKKVLQDLQRANAVTESYYVDPALKHLPKAVIRRIVWLDSILKRPESAADTVNIEAVRKAYIDESLEIRPGYFTYWAGGRQKTDYINDHFAIGRDPNAVCRQWVKEEGGVRVYLEEPREPLPQMAAHTSYLPMNLDEHH